MKTTWNHLVKNVEKIEKKETSAKPDDKWTYQVFLVLYLNLGFEMLRDPVMPKEVMEELDTCYSKATEIKKKTRRITRSKLQEEQDQDPHWLEVVTDILLSLLSRDQHLLRTVVVSVWSMLAEHITVDVLQQVLDVIDPSRKENPLMAADELDEESSDDDSGEDEEVQEEEMEDQQQQQGGSEDEEDEDMDDEEEEETVTDKLRMRIHQALGDSAALTDTVICLIALKPNYST